MNFQIGRALPASTVDVGTSDALSASLNLLRDHQESLQLPRNGRQPEIVRYLSDDLHVATQVMRRDRAVHRSTINTIVRGRYISCNEFTVGR